MRLKQPKLEVLLGSALLILLSLTSAQAMTNAATCTDAEASFRAEARNYNAGMTAAAALSNIIYVPAKMVYVAGGAVTSGLAYVVTLGDESTSREILEATTGGDQIVTPAIIAGDRRVQFSG